MTKAIYSVFLLLLPSFAFAQQSKVDSLQKILSTYSQEDTTKILLLNQIAEAYLLNYQFDLGLQLNEEALALSEKLYYKKGKGFFWRNVAVFHGKGDISFDYYWRAMQVFKEFKDMQAIKVTWEYEVNFEDFEKAMGSLSKALHLFEKEGDKVMQAEILQSMATHALRQNKNTDALEYTKKASQMYEETENPQGTIAALLNTMRVYEKQGEKEKSIKSKLALTKAVEKIEDKAALAMSLHLIGEFYVRQSMNAFAIDYFLRCSHTCKEQDDVLMAYTLFSVGQLYHTIDYYHKSTLYYHEVVRIAEKISPDPRLNMVSYYNFLGFSYASEKALEKAMQYHLKAKALAEKDGDEFGQAQSLDGIGQVYQAQGKYQEGLSYLFQALARFDKFKKKWITSYLCLYIAGCYYGLGNVEESLVYGLKSYSFANQSNTSETKMKSSLLLAQAYEKLGQYKQAYQFQSIHLAVKDSFLGRENFTRLADIEIKSLTEKNQQEMALLEKDKQLHIEENKNQRLLLFSISGALLSAILLAVALYINNQNKQKINRQLAAQKEEIQAQAKNLSQVNVTKDKLFAIIGHDLRSPINSLSSMMSLLEEQDISVDEFILFSGKLKKGVEHVHFTLNNLLLWANSQMQGLQTKPQITNLQDLLIENFNLLEAIAKSKNISLLNKIPADAQVWADTDQINLVFRNMISNALKFTTNGGSISVAGEQKGEIWELAVTDTGVGMSAETIAKLFKKENYFSTQGTGGEKGIGLGLLLCQEMIERNGGKIWVASEIGKGTTFRFTLPNFLPL